MIKKTGCKLYIKWKSYDSLCNYWINANDIV